MHIPPKKFGRQPEQWSNYQSLDYLAIANSFPYNRPVCVIESVVRNHIFLPGVTRFSQMNL